MKPNAKKDSPVPFKSDWKVTGWPSSSMLPERAQEWSSSEALLQNLNTVDRKFAFLTCDLSQGKLRKMQQPTVDLKWGCDLGYKPDAEGARASYCGWDGMGGARHGQHPP